MSRSALRKCALILPAAIFALALSGCKTGEGPKAPAKAQWAPAAKVETMPAKAELPPGDRRNYAVGEKYVWKGLNGREEAREVIGVDGSVVELQVSTGCYAKVDLDGFPPVTKWSNCWGNTGSQKIGQRTGNIFPLAVGNTESWKFNGKNNKGESWSGVRTCKVAGTVNVAVPAGNFDTYHVICREKWSRRDYYFSPELEDIVIQAQAPAGGAKKGRRAHFELVRIEPAT